MFPHNPVRNETRGKSAISAWPLIKTAGEAKISGSFLQSKAPQTPPRILAGDSPEFSLYAPMRKAPAAEKFTAFIHRLCLSVSARRIRFRRNFFARGLRRFKFFRRSRHRERGDFPMPPAGRREKPKNLAKTGENACKESLFLRLYTARSGPMQFAAARTPPDPEGSNGSDLPNVPWVA